jgi:cell division cycle 14
MHAELIELIPQRLAFASGTAASISSLKEEIRGTNVSFVSYDLHRIYEPYAEDFGPVNLGIVHRFCDAFAKRLLKSNNALVVYCFHANAKSRANACFLLGSLLVLRFGWTVQQASLRFQAPNVPFQLEPFCNPLQIPQTFELSLQDCLSGLAKATEHGYYDHQTFDLKMYESLGSPLSGNLHQICTKFVAFKGPLSEGSKHGLKNEIALPPSHYFKVFHQLGVSCIIRLNEPDCYNR